MDRNLRHQAPKVARMWRLPVDFVSGLPLEVVPRECPQKAVAISPGLWKWQFLQPQKKQTPSTHGGFHSHGGSPIAGWFRRESPKKKMDDDTGGTPMIPYDLGNPKIRNP